MINTSDISCISPSHVFTVIIIYYISTVIIYMISPPSLYISYLHRRHYKYYISHLHLHLEYLPLTMITNAIVKQVLPVFVFVCVLVYITVIFYKILDICPIFSCDISISHFHQQCISAEQFKMFCFCTQRCFLPEYQITNICLKSIISAKSYL